MPRTTKESLRRARMEADQNKREAQCQANGHLWRNEYNTMRYCETCYELVAHNWIEPGNTVAHKQDPCWSGTVLSITSAGVRVRRAMPGGSIETTFQANELRIIIPAVESEVSE